MPSIERVCSTPVNCYLSVDARDCGPIRRLRADTDLPNRIIDHIALDQPSSIGGEIDSAE